jgi:hypothetical protein
LLIIKGSSNNSFWRTNESFCPWLRQAKAALFSNKAFLPFLPEGKNLLFAAQKQLLEPPLSGTYSRQIQGI